jgi:hypothetical protein
MNAIMCWNTRYEMAIIDRRGREDHHVGTIAREHISAARFAHINHLHRLHLHRLRQPVAPRHSGRRHRIDGALRPSRRIADEAVRNFV